MSKISWTPEQLQAIEARGTNLLVSAAAGSGKTALLTERLRQLILKDRIDCSRILVLTFTRAAAAEMKQRFKQSLYASIYEDGWNLSEQEIVTQINGLTDAQISTIDSFASAMVRRYFEVAGVDPGFRIADDAELNLLIDETIDEIFEDLFIKAEETNERENDFLKLIDLYGGSKSNDGLKNLIKELLLFFDSIPYPDEWVKEATEKYKVLNEEVLESEFFRPLYLKVKGVVSQARKNYLLLRDEVEQIPFSKKEPREDFRNEIETVLGLSDTKNFKELLQGINQIPFFDMRRFPRSVDKDYKDYINTLRGSSKKGLVKELKDIGSRYGSYDISTEIEKVQEMNKLFLALIEIMRIVEKALKAKKEKARILSFADLEKALLRILDDPKVQENIQQEFEYVFIDEYQDTNLVQEAIINKIERGNNKFMVGDIKQSIYAFRNADPTIFLDRYQEYKEDNSPDELVLLNRNFRSSPEVIDGINNIFEKIMSKSLGDLDYNDEAKLIASRNDNTPKPEVYVITGITEDDEDTDTFVDKDKIQARFIARKIREMVSQPGSQIKYSDIAILYRSIKRRAELILEVFSEEGIPVVYEGESTQVETQEVSIFLKFLNLIDNHKQDIPLLSIMHLPIFDFSLDDEVAIRLAFPDTAYFYEATENYMHEFNDDLAYRLRSFYEKLDEWRELSRHIPLEDFLWNLLLDSKYYDYIGGLAGGHERKQNLRLLLDRAVSYKDSSLKGLPSFLQYVSRLQKKGEILSSNVGGNTSNDAVSLMTVHKSKGLEFPIVFLADTNRRFNLNRSGDLILHKDNLYAAKHLSMEEDVLIKNKTIFQEALSEQKRQEEYSEEMRLLYVALTRAKDQLIIVGTTDDLNKSKERWNKGTEAEILLKQRCFLDWIMSALYNDELRLHENIEGFETRKWNVHFVDQATLLNDSDYIEESEEEDGQDYASLKEMIFEKLNKVPQEFKNRIPLKMSVSRIKKHGIEHQDEVELNKLNGKKETKASSAEIGTAVHKFLQHIDLDAYLESEDKLSEIESQKNDLISKGILNQELKDDIDNQLIQNFFESNLGKRLITSYTRNKQNVLKEMPFSMDLKSEELKEIKINEERNLQVSGIFDTCFIENNEWILVDYKTDHFYSKKSVDQKLDEYSLQLNIYAKALERLTQIPVKEKHIYFLSENTDYSV